MAAMSGKLVICPTPIGNLADMTLRALDELRCADVVCAEDTRVTGKLLAHFGIEKSLMRLDEASINSATAAGIIDRVEEGQRVVYCSDAGTPGVSDPGLRLVEAVRGAGGTVEVLPGACAASTAYVAAGFNNPAFHFAGFFPRKDGERRAVLESLRTLDAVLVFYESPHRLASALAVVADVLPNREVAVCRELTKRYEEVVRGAAPQVASEFMRRDADGGIKGEIAFVVGPATEAERAGAQQDARSAAADRAAQLLADGSCSKKDAVAVLRREYGISRNEAYDLVHGAR